ncbi:MAG: DUF4406 domain-containing protein [Bacteroidales bacterium]
MRKRVYIAGKITGLPYQAVFCKFEAASNRLQKAGYKPVSPIDICEEGWSWARCMRVCVEELTTNCDGIYLLPDWHDSPGAKIEVEMAKRNNLEFIKL